MLIRGPLGFGAIRGCKNKKLPSLLQVDLSCGRIR